MEKVKTKYTIVSSFSDLPQEAKDYLEKIGWRCWGKAANNLKVLLKGNELISFVHYCRDGNVCRIHQIEQNPRKSFVEFIRTNKTTPARYLLEVLIKEGVRVFHCHALTPRGEVMFNGFIRRKLTEPQIQQEFKITSRWINLAKKRTKIRQTAIHAK